MLHKRDTSCSGNSQLFTSDVCNNVTSLTCFVVASVKYMNVFFLQSLVVAVSSSEISPSMQLQVERYIEKPNCYVPR